MWVQLAGVLFFSLIFDLSFGLDCNRAPTASLRHVCNQLQEWDAAARTVPATTEVKPHFLKSDRSDSISRMYDCKTIRCLCPWFGGSGGNNCKVRGAPLGKAVRKEYRMLTDDERNRLHNAFRAIKNSGEYDGLARVHGKFAVSSGAHSGPAFLPWHREFIKRMEFSLRKVDPSISLPYWDSTLDGVLPDPKDSIMWTNEFMGESHGGSVSGGPFINWKTLEGHSSISRTLGVMGNLFSESEVSLTLQQRNISLVMAYTASDEVCPLTANFDPPEYSHGDVHIYIGGDMMKLSTSANDPLFFLLHAFVDFIWESWRQSKQTRFTREQEWPRDNIQCSSAHHFVHAAMRPFGSLLNKDGLSNRYTDNLYTYAARPSCQTGPDCGSKWLFCDYSHGNPHCAAKIKLGGNCSGIVREEPMCYKGVCQRGVCVSRSRASSVPTMTATNPIAVQWMDTCSDGHQSCAQWASTGECFRNPNYMNVNCMASCGRCTPKQELRKDCLDRHFMCLSWSQTGECAKNPMYMNQNCRKSCNKCF